MKFSFVLLILFTAILTNVSFINGGDDGFESGTEGPTRKPRFLSFETTDDKIRIDMEFAIPFLTIPIKKTLESTFGSPDILSNFPTVNVNIGAIFLAGVVAFGSTLLMPLLSKNMLADGFQDTNTFSRILENSEIDSHWLMDAIRAAGASMDSDCGLRVLCWSARNAAAIMSKGDVSNAAKSLNDLSNNPLVTSLINGTTLGDAITIGYSGGDCAAKYHECTFTQEIVRNFVSEMSNFIGSK